MKLMSDLSFLWLVLCEEGAWVVIYCNRVDCEPMCGLLDRFCQVIKCYKCVICDPLPS